MDSNDNNFKVKIMEKYGLVDKTKEELINIALEQEANEDLLRQEFDNTTAKLAHTKNALKKSEKSICALCVICIVYMICIMVLLFDR